MTNLPSTTDPRLRAATAEQATRQLQLLFSNLPVKGGESPQAVMAGYLLAVESYPLWAIEAAIKAFLRHEVPGQSKSFCPRAPELSAAVKAVLAPVYGELQRARDQARAEWVSPRHGPSPFEIRQTQLKREFAGREVLAEGLTGGDFSNRQWPAGTVHVPAYGGRVFAPTARKEA